MSVRRAPKPSCWSCDHPTAALIGHPGQCARCAELSARAAPPVADDACLRCGRESFGVLCESCSDAPDVWALLGAGGSC